MRPYSFVDFFSMEVKDPTAFFEPGTPGTMIFEQFDRTNLWKMIIYEISLKVCTTHISLNEDESVIHFLQN